MVEFPPPSSGGGVAGVEPAYPSAPARPGFVFPPPRQSSGSVRDAGRYVGEKLRDVTDTADWAAETSRNQGQVLVDYGDRLDNKVEAWAVPTIMPLSATINRWADPTFQLSDMMVPIMSGATDAAGHNHIHTVSTMPLKLQRGAGTPGRIYYAFITPAINRAYEQLNFMVSEVAGTPCQMDIGVYVLDAATKTLTRQVHVQDAAAGLQLAESVVTVRFPTWVSTQGSYVMVAWLQHGSGLPRMILGLDDTPRPLPTEIQFPHKISAIHSGTGHTALPTSIDGASAAQVDFSGFWFTPYAELSESVPAPLRAFVENWPDVGSGIGRPWVALTDPGIGSGGGYTAAYGVGIRVSVYDTPLATDRVRVRSSIHRPGSGAGNRRSTLVVRGTNNLRSGCGLSALTDSRYEFITWSNLAVTSNEEWADRTVLATIPRVPTQGDQIEVDFIDGLVTVRINGVEQVSDLSVPGLEGPAHRFVGVQNRRQAFLIAAWSPWFGPWSARDLPQSAGDDEDNNAD